VNSNVAPVVWRRPQPVAVRLDDRAADGLANLLAAYAQSIAQLDWMSPATRAAQPALIDGSVGAAWASKLCELAKSRLRLRELLPLDQRTAEERMFENEESRAESETQAARTRRPGRSPVSRAESRTGSSRTRAER
jgi:hypothetical protein